MKLSNPNNSKTFLKEVIYRDCDFSLIFRPLLEEDAELIYNAVMNSLENLKRFMDWAHKPQSIAAQLIRIRESQANFETGLEYDLSVFDQKTNEFLISASLSRSRAPNKKALNIGYWTSSHYCNKGLATIATKILTVLAFEHFNCDRVEIGCNKANQASLRVIEKCSFKFEGESRNYFSKPTVDMVKNGYCSERTCQYYSLIRKEIENIAWYK